MKKYSLIILVLILTSISESSSSQTTGIETGLKSITKESLMQTTGYLSSKKFKGRLQGSIEYDMAARYVGLRFKEIGLLPVNQNSMIHYFNDECNIINNATLELINHQNQIEKTFELGEDFICRGFSGSGNVVGEVVFCGFGVTTNEYDDYKNIDVKGKIVMVFKAAPQWKNTIGNWGDTSPRGKARLAKQNGAIAIILINLPSDLPQRALIGSVACGEKPHLADFPMLQAGNNVVELLLNNTNENISDVYSKITTSKNPKSISLNRKLKISVDAVYTEEKPTANVIAKIDGIDKKLKEEYIIVGAHLDHVGYQGNVIFPGANDNASGVASLIEIAEAIKKSGMKLKRSILFVVFSSEESGLRGSKYFVSNSPIPTDNMIAMLNFDCVGQGDSIALGGRLSYPKLWNIAKQKDNEYTKILSINTFGGGGADAEAFHKERVPTLYFNTSGGYKFLHLPTDKTETLNPIMFEKLTKLGFLTIIELANGSYSKERDF
ncbi:MAG: M20/M25/M40 family metallo-hydrolase [Tenuifilaceae bacterium]